MKHGFFLPILTAVVLFQCSQGEKQIEEKWLDVALDRAIIQYKYACEQYTDFTKIPRSANPDGTLYTCNPKDWTSGYFSGTLWLLYDYTDDEYWKENAIKWTDALHEQPTGEGKPDVGVKVNLSYGHGYRLTQNEDYKAALIWGADSLVNQYSETVGCIKSWDWSPKWKFPVIIDALVNLEFLYEAANFTADKRYIKLANTHANTTLENHFRADGSSFHVVDYDPETGNVLEKVTHQGHSDESAWARGQAWGLHGYTMCYRYIKNERFLDQAHKIANFFLKHPNLPEDMIPYWDFDAPGIPNEPRDASAAAMVASALIELSGYGENNDYYLDNAELILKSLASERYLAETGTNNNFLLMHCTGHFPGNSEIDVPLVYGDYYFVEALLRYKRAKGAE